MTPIRRGAPITPAEQRRLLRAIVASAAVGVVVYPLTMYVALPELASRLSDDHVRWLRDAFVDHPVFVLVGILLIAGLLGLPVLAVFLWVYRRGRN
jgi:hypothetical protein